MTSTHYLSSKASVDHVAISLDNSKIAENDYNLSVSSYVEAKDTREHVNITELNEEITTIVAKSINCVAILI